MKQEKTLRWLYFVPGRKKLYIVALILVQALHGASGVFYALLLQRVVDAAADGAVPGFWWAMIWIALLVAVQLALRAGIRWLTELSKATVENLFKRRLAEALLHKDFLAVSAVHSGEWLNRLTNDTVVVANNYVEILPGLVGMIVKLLSAVAMMSILEPRFAAILIPVGVVLVVFTWLFRKILKQLHKDVQAADGRLRVFLQERISNMLMVRSFAAEQQTEKELERRLQAHKSARMQKNRFSNLCNIGFGAAMSGMYLFGVCWCGYGILIGTISFGTLTAVTQLISQIQTPFANITGYLPKYYAMLGSAERLMEAESFADHAAEVKSLQEMQRLYETGLQAIGLWDVGFCYVPAVSDAAAISKQNMPAALKHLSLEIRKGEYVAFTGHSGCGKSTALKLLMCVYDLDHGKRYYVNQYDQRADLTDADLRLFAYVPQGNYLMSGTIREVVSFAAPEDAYDGARLSQALRIACAEEFVSELDAGLDTRLGERGTGLSEGQMQRLAIARAVFSGSPILLLDEATSALDSETEQRLLQNLRRMTDKTVVIVTHRPAVLSICDRVLEFTESGVMCYDP